MPRHFLPGPSPCWAYAANWALIVAGSNTYSNYRHQADVAHAYLMLKNHGYDDAHIVTMMYDDIARNSQNPYKDNLVNHPCPDCPNVYPGANKIDYTGNTVTPANFLNILQGNKAAMKGIGNGKVIESTSEDNIFVFFSDHGAPGIVAFPAGGYLHATDLNAVLKKMSDNKQFKEMVLYIEACESGSMFAGLLPSNIKIYATTAANPEESSWACYWEPTRRAYLGDTYSVMFLEDSDTADMATETFQDQYLILKAKTTQSHVMQYGDMSIASEPIGNFLTMPARTKPAKCPKGGELDVVSSRDVKLATLLKTLPLVSDETEKANVMVEIEKELVSRHKADRRMGALVHKMTGSRKLFTQHPNVIGSHDCVKFAVKAFENACGQFDDYSLSHVKSLVNLCNAGHSHLDIHNHAVSICRA